MWTNFIILTKKKLDLWKKLKNWDFRCSFDFVDKKLFLGKLQSPKKSQLSGRQTLTCKFFPGCLETLQTVWKLYRLSVNFLDCPKTFQTVRKFPDCLENVHTFRILLTLPGNFPDCLETFQTVRKLFQLPGNFPDCPETFSTVWKLS